MTEEKTENNAARLFVTEEALDQDPEPIPAEAVYTAAVKNSGPKMFVLVVSLVIVAVLVVIFATGAGTVDEPEAISSEVVQTTDRITPAATIERNVQYQGCGHTESEILQAENESELLGKSFAQLEAEGWQVTRTGSERVRLLREEAGLCAEDKSKRTLKTTENGLGIYTGGRGCEGELLSEMKLSIKDLPADMQQQLADGGIEFAGEDELAQTLDSLDEFVGSEETIGNI